MINPVHNITAACSATRLATGGKSNDDQVLGQLSAGYMLTDDWKVYTRVARGYKPSGYNIVPTAGLDAKPFVAEKSINYELGTRYETADVTLQAATFYTHTKDMQLYSGPVGMQTLSNAVKPTPPALSLKRSGGLRRAGHGISMAT